MVTLSSENMARARRGVPPDLGAALASDPAAAAFFDRMSYTARRKCIEWIESAGWTEVRRGRLKRVLARFHAPSRL